MSILESPLATIRLYESRLLSVNDSIERCIEQKKKPCTNMDTLNALEDRLLYLRDTQKFLMKAFGISKK